MHRILKTVLPNFTSIIDEKGCEHKVKIEESLVKKTKRGNEMPDDKYYIHVSLQMVELSTCHHLETCIPCHCWPLSFIASIAQTLLTDATVNHQFVRGTTLRLAAAKFKFYFLSRKATATRVAVGL